MSNIDVVKKVNDYLRHYNEERIQEKLGYLTHTQRIWGSGSLKRVFYMCLKFLGQSK